MSTAADGRQAGGMNERTVDVVVIGAGAIGENVAGRAVRGGLSVVLVEAELVGGECSYWACMPSKALLRAGEALTTIRAVPGAGAAVTGALDPAQVLAWRDRIAANWDDAGQVEWVRGAGIELIRGHARLVGERRVQVEPADGSDSDEGPVQLLARQAVVIATGSVPTIPAVPGLDPAPYWTSREATSSHEIPRSLLVLGGGVVGVELAQAYRSLGSAVTLISSGGLLARHEPFAAELVRDSLAGEGITVITQAEVTSVATVPRPATESVTESVTEPATGSAAVSVPEAADLIRLSLADGSTVTGDRLLIATGRTPTTHDLGLEQFGITPGDPLEVDDSGRVNAVAGGWLYAAGDVNGRAPLTHQGKYQARAIGDVIAARAAGTVADVVEPWSAYAMTADHQSVPQVVFTRPQVASVGLTAAQAGEQYPDVRCVNIPISVGGSSVHSEDYTGRAQLVIDEQRGVVVGATFVGPDVAELLHSATVAVVAEVPLHRLWHAVPSYPTISEVWLRLLEEYGL
jgi:pyruvate/2-oxoglutarate dehydrogenase complex dihydrolipoamide dehydrogenase (E3) component